MRYLYITASRIVTPSHSSGLRLSSISSSTSGIINHLITKDEQDRHELELNSYLPPLRASNQRQSGDLLGYPHLDRVGRVLPGSHDPSLQDQRAEIQEHDARIVTLHGSYILSRGSK